MQASISRQARIMSEQLLNQSKTATVAVTLKVYERLVRIDSTAGAFNLTLPSVAEAQGLEFSLFMLVDNGDVTVKDSADSIGWTDLTLGDVGDHVLCRSDGRCWHVQKIGVA